MTPVNGCIEQVTLHSVLYREMVSFPGKCVKPCPSDPENLVTWLSTQPKPDTNSDTREWCGLWPSGKAPCRRGMLAGPRLKGNVRKGKEML